MKLSGIVVTTSVSGWMPSTERLEASLGSLVGMAPVMAPVKIVCDALPTFEEAETLKEIDAGKWRSHWKETTYAEYKRRVRKVAEAYKAEVIEATTFGHLAGSVRLGLEDYNDDDVVFITQHDLRIIDPGSLPVDTICDRIRDRGPTRYVLLQRDAPDSPRSTQFFGNSGSRDLFLDLNGGFSDQSHFTRVGWYREHVLAKCDRTCMEHVVGFGKNRLPSGSTVSLVERRVDDLVHGSMIPGAELRRYLGDFGKWYPVGGGPYRETEWPVVHFNARGLPLGAVAHPEDDASRPGDFYVLAAPLSSLWTAQVNASVRALAVSNDSLAVGASDGGVSIFDLKQGTLLRHDESSSGVVWSLTDDLIVGDSRGLVRRGSLTLRDRLSGWVRAIARRGHVLYCVGCSSVTPIDATTLEPVGPPLDAGRTSSDEEEWRRHDILCLATSTERLAAGLVDGSLRVWGNGEDPVIVVPRAHSDRVVGVFFTSEEDTVLLTTAKDATVKRWACSENGVVERSSRLLQGRILQTAHSSPFLVVATADRILVLDDETLDLRLDHPINKTTSLAAAVVDDVLHVFTGDTAGTVTAYRWAT